VTTPRNPPEPGERPYSERPPWELSAILLGGLGVMTWLLFGWADHWTVFIPALVFFVGFICLIG